MREIKFRAWNGKEMSEPFGIWDIEIDESFRYYLKGFKAYGNEAIMQYTGLKDKQGKEIFEGDIVKEGGIVSVIEWAKDNARFCYKTETGVVGLYGFYGEIIGNVFENPEMVEK